MNDSVEKILFDPTIGRLVTIVVIAILIIAISRFIKSRSTKIVKDIDLRYKARKVITFVSYVLIILLVSIVFSDKLSGLTVALGVAGAGIAFALQEVIASVAGWLAISFSKFYKVGDRVQLGGNVGDVIDIGILRTTLMECRQWVDGDFPFLWDEIKIPIRYGSDIVLAREILNKAALETTNQFVPDAKQQWNEMKGKFRIEDASVEPLVFMIANDNWLEFSLRYVVDFRSRRVTKDKLFAFILNEINKTDSKVQFASATVELVAASSLNVNIKQ